MIHDNKVTKSSTGFLAKVEKKSQIQAKWVKSNFLPEPAEIPHIIYYLYKTKSKENFETYS